MVLAVILHMANHKSTKKKIILNELRRKRNRYKVQNCKSAIKKLKIITNKNEAMSFFNKIASMLDRLALKHIYHRNKTARIKSSLSKLINAM